MEQDASYWAAYAVLGLTLGPLLFFGVGRWILLPVDRAGRARHLPVQFSLADFLCLFLTVQVPLTLAAWWRREAADVAEVRFLWLVLTILAWIIAPLIWWTAAKAISKAGVSGGVPRILFMGMIVPTVYYGLVPFAGAAVVCGAHIIAGNAATLLGYNSKALLLAVLLGCALVVCGVLTRQILAAVGAIEYQRDGSDAVPASTHQ